VTLALTLLTLLLVIAVSVISVWIRRKNLYAREVKRAREAVEAAETSRRLWEVMDEYTHQHRRPNDSTQSAA
jgi:Na+-transporting methylmalonyl-CoA/oxaloacetate decarboxylase gamma subunit